MAAPRVGERLFLITSGGDDDVALVARALATVPPGSTLVQLRAKTLGGRALVERGRALLAVCRAATARLVVNDRVDVALAIGADGVHLPEVGLGVPAARALLGPGRLVGASTHDPASAAARVAEGADLVTIGPVWDTPSKRGLGEPLGLAAVGEAARAVTRRGAVFALGGIESPARARAAIAAGADGVAVIRAVFAAADPGAAARALDEAVDLGLVDRISERATPQRDS